ncbi:hypothetical protein MNBD_ALPHA04-2346 [hydrothermal vent metagenome]|uniref:NadR/Ttd14 AAA domain-containing protein n=1 Tax=hydrothermal vent metagenome TaxID=652676 RepID=A0A3B0T0L0_9ZZZZ
MRADRPLDYSLEILRLDIENFKKAANLRCNLLFDRGFADNAGFLDLMGLTKPKGLDEACCNMRYNGPIFVAPLWREIYQMDSDRIQDWEEAKATHIAVCAAWKQYGYDFVELPKADVGERENFVRQRMA